jgi:predicted amidophosphoribosyltransferase
MLCVMLNAFLDLLLPQGCVGCDDPCGPLCPGCAAVWPARRTPGSPQRGLPECWSAADYAGPLRRAILAYKERARTALAARLAEMLAFTAVTALGGRPPAGRVVLVPVPSARRAVRARGHDPVARLAALAAHRMGAMGVCAVSRPMLALSRRTADQAGLSATERAANLHSSLRATPRLRGTPEGPLVLVDDIVTTGATLAEASRALRAIGAEARLAVTLAATRLRSSPR